MIIIITIIIIMTMIIIINNDTAGDVSCGDVDDVDMMMIVNFPLFG